ncbi:non-ribosomal peptide synthetase [Oscillatoria acuminata]|uniref:Amino acid adenylation enzyme/thioester reductase family protein n=1 Tax=Oscillatoria acuminata PCC 6304 TaxID=56110 RepID=K9TLD2_9CYAN|nr:non-ribosomal peptide synthetase [Oscillatoria acuminata]AFY82809.1 amino acid adenylation enzyme/thioester reductase family protein [Oscillatoria acuminata PCC 6304]
MVMELNQQIQQLDEEVTIFPPSFAQQRLWFIDRLGVTKAVYNIPAAVRLTGELDVLALENSLQAIVDRHEVFRTGFALAEGELVQAIAPTVEFTLNRINLQHLPESSREAQGRQLAETDASQGFDLSRPPLLRGTLIQLDRCDWILLLTMHHIISDGWSIGVLIRELSTLYAAFSQGKPSPLPELPIQYADFALWQRDWLQGEVLEAQLSYWKQQLGGTLPMLDLPGDRPRSPVQTFPGASHSFRLPKALSDSLQALSQQQGVTLYMTLLAAFNILLGRYSGQGDILIGSPIANRTSQELEPLIGFFVNTLVLRTDVSDNSSVVDLLARVRNIALDAFAHQDLPFEKLVEALQPERDLSRTPLFQVMFVLQNAPMSVVQLPGVCMTPVELHSGTAKFDLTLYVTETEGGLKANLEYNRDLFTPATVARMGEHFHNLLTAIAANPQQRVSALPLASPAEQALLTEWNRTKADYPRHCTIPDLFEAQVERTPDAVAFVCGDRTLTYRELNRQANQLAHVLQQSGVTNETIVGIAIERSLLAAVGILGILKAGGAYLPLDPAYPQERLGFMLKDAGVSLLVTQQHLLTIFPSHSIPTICLDSEGERLGNQSPENPQRQLTPDAIAYIIYTSGSTGTPKAVQGLHRGAINRFAWMWKTYPFALKEVCCQKTSLNFVDSVWELFGPLLQGIKTVIIPDKIVKNPQKFIEVLAQEQVTRLVLVPAFLSVLLETYPDLSQRLSALNLWVTSGEALSVDLLQHFHNSLPNRLLLNLYGSSEVSADVTCYASHPGEIIPDKVSIGRPIANTQIYILDEAFQPVPIGVRGEIYVGGEGLARGYLNRTELTAERFIKMPGNDSPGVRLYKTGDLGRYLPDGNIQYLGRQDNQVKIRGFRIELAEVEAALRTHPEIQNAVVIVREDEPGNQRLVAYLVCRETGRNLSSNAWREFLLNKLPEYMVPTAFVPLEVLPLNPNGKVDRHALPKPSHPTINSGVNYQKPRTKIEETIASVWKQLLSAERVGIHDNFFEMGGHSLLLMQVHHQLQKTLNREFPLVILFQYPTIATLANYFVPPADSATIHHPSEDRATHRIAAMNRRKQRRNSIKNSDPYSNS